MKKTLLILLVLLGMNNFAQEDRKRLTEDDVRARMKNLLRADLLSVSAGSEFQNIEVLDIDFTQFYSENPDDVGIAANGLFGFESLYENNTKSKRLTVAAELLGSAIVLDNILLGIVLIEPGYFSVQDKKSEKQYGGFAMGGKVLLGFSDKFLTTIAWKRTFRTENYSLVRAHGTYCITDKIKITAEKCVYTGNYGNKKIDLELSESSYFNIEALYEVHRGRNVEAGLNFHNRNEAGKLSVGATLKMRLF